MAGIINEECIYLATRKPSRASNRDPLGGDPPVSNIDWSVWYLACRPTHVLMSPGFRCKSMRLSGIFCLIKFITQLRMTNPIRSGITHLLDNPPRICVRSLWNIVWNWWSYSASTNRSPRCRHGFLPYLWCDTSIDTAAAVRSLDAVWTVQASWMLVPAYKDWVSWSIPTVSFQ